MSLSTNHLMSHSSLHEKMFLSEVHLCHPLANCIFLICHFWIFCPIVMIVIHFRFHFNSFLSGWFYRSINQICWLLSLCDVCCRCLTSYFCCTSLQWFCFCGLLNFFGCQFIFLLLCFLFWRYLCFLLDEFSLFCCFDCCSWLKSIWSNCVNGFFGCVSLDVDCTFMFSVLFSIEFFVFLMNNNCVISIRLFHRMSLRVWKREEWNRFSSPWNYFFSFWIFLFSEIKSTTIVVLSSQFFVLSIVDSIRKEGSWKFLWRRTRNPFEKGGKWNSI